MFVSVAKCQNLNNRILALIVVVVLIKILFFVDVFLLSTSWKSQKKAFWLNIFDCVIRLFWLIFCASLAEFCVIKKIIFLAFENFITRSLISKIRNDPSFSDYETQQIKCSHEKLLSRWHWFCNLDCVIDSSTVFWPIEPIQKKKSW